jgi:metal transporter CNNM
VGLELSDEDGNPKKLYIKDLPLYPLPIVRDDIPMYDLLNMFQIGMARY